MSRAFKKTLPVLLAAYRYAGISTAYLALSLVGTAHAAIASASPTVGADPDAVALDTIEVKSDVLKMNAPLTEMPQAISILTRSELDAQNVQSVQEALRYIPSVQTELTGRQGYEEFLIRGYDQSRYQYRDGLLMDPGYLQTQESFGLERIEVLKGPASVLYGEISPGGLVNLVSKTPRAARVADFGLTAGSFGLVTATADVGGALDAAENWRARLPVLYSDRKDSENYITSRRVYAAPSLSWQPSSATDLTFLAVYQDDRYQRTIPLPVSGTLAHDPVGVVSPAVYLGEPNLRLFQSPQYQVGYLLRQDISGGWEFRQKVRFTSYSVTGPLLFATLDPSGEGADGRTVSRSGIDYWGRFDVFSNDNQLEKRFKSGRIEHQVMLGFDDLHYRAHSYGNGFDLGSIDLFTPVYGAKPVSTGPLFDGESILREWGGYGQYRAKLDDFFIAQAGIRYSSVRNVSISLPDGGRTEQPDHKTTYSVGLMYLGPVGISPYLSYAESFEPQVGYDPLFDGSTPPPSLGQQAEVGLKWTTPGRHYELTVAAFDLVRKNIINSDPTHPGYSVLVGEERHKGVELELAAKPTDFLNVRASYSYLNAVITRSENGDQGLAPANVPKNSASLFATLSGQAVGLPAAETSLGIRSVGDRRGEVAEVTLPSYAAVDLGLRYHIHEVTVGINAKNLFDKRYFSGMLFGGVTPGEPRIVLASVTVNLR